MTIICASPMMVSELLSDRVGRRTNDGIRNIPKTSPKIKARTSRKQRDETVITKGPGTIILRYHGGQFHQIPADPRHSIRWVAFRRDGRSGVAVGNKGLVLNFNGVTFEQQNSPSQENLRCASYNTAGEAIIVGNHGTILYSRDGELTPINEDTKDNLRRVSWSPDGSAAIVVGNNGTALSWRELRLLRWTTNQLEVIRFPESGLYPAAIGWAPQDVRALIGTGSPHPPGRDEGRVLEYREGSIRRLYSGTYRITCIAWNPREDYAVIVGQKAARTFTT